VISEGQHFLKEVGDQEDGGSASRYLANRVMESFDFVRRQRGRRLVHDDHVRILREGTHDLDLLLVSNSQTANLRLGVKVELSELDELGVAPPHLLAVGKRSATRHASEQDVLLDGRVRDEHDLLSHHRDAGLDALVRITQRLFATRDRQDSAVRRLDACHELGQGRLARTVLTHEAEDRASRNLEGHTADSSCGPECLHHVANRHDGSGGAHVPTSTAVVVVM
jgi:hypothetical protein